MFKVTTKYRNWERSTWSYINNLILIEKKLPGGRFLFLFNILQMMYPATNADPILHPLFVIEFIRFFSDILVYWTLEVWCHSAVGLLVSLIYYSLSRSFYSAWFVPVIAKTSRKLVNGWLVGWFLSLLRSSF